MIKVCTIRAHTNDTLCERCKQRDDNNGRYKQRQTKRGFVIKTLCTEHNAMEMNTLCRLRSTERSDYNMKRLNDRKCLTVFYKQEVKEESLNRANMECKICQYTCFSTLIRNKMQKASPKTMRQTMFLDK